MSKIIMIHSFRRGVGRSTLIANIAALLAIEGTRVGVIDTNIQSPSLHWLFRLDEANITCSLNQYLWGQCSLNQAVHNVTPNLRADIKGQIFLVPSVYQPQEMARILSKRYDMEPLNTGLQQLSEELQLDVLLIDPQSGLNEDTLSLMTLSDIVVILMRPDRQDYQGTSIMIDVVRKLDVPQLMLLVNEVPIAFDLNEVSTRIKQTFNCPVAAVVPHSEEMLVLGSNGIFVQQHPDNPLTELYRQIANKLIV